MRKFLLPLAVLLVFLFVTACQRSVNQETVEQKLYVFGTVVTISYYGVDPATAERAGAAISSDFQNMHREWHAWEPGPLVDLNQAIAAGRPAPVPPSLLPLVDDAKRIYRLSDGLFNPAIGRLLNLWGFQSSERPSGPPPSRASVQTLVDQNPSMEDLEVRDGVLYSRNRAVHLDFGGIAKGYAVDLALKRLQEMGVQNAIVNAGGGLGVIGAHGERSWRVGIRHPQGAGVLASLEMHDGESVHTSGNYERFREYQDLHYAHILDPRTGWPVAGITSASVIDRNGTLADAAATALVIVGADHWQAAAQKMGIRYAMLVEENGTVHMTPAMERRVEFTGDRPARIVISAPL